MHLVFNLVEIHIHRLRFLIVSLVILIINVQKSEAVFRFCLRGLWHELKEGDCPYGLLFNKILDTPCFYTQGKDNTSARIWPTVCDTPFVNDNEDFPAIVGEDFILAQKNGQIQLVQYGITEPADKLPIWDDVVDITTCQDQCYLMLDTDNVPLGSSHEDGDSNEAEHGLGAQEEIDETQKMSITDQTLRLGDFLFDELNEDNPNRADSAGPDLRIVKIYKKTIKILGKTCPHPFIPEDFRNRILSGFLFLVADTGIGEMDDITVEEFEDIMTALKTCEDKYPTFRIEGTVCSMKTIANEIIKILPDGEELSAAYKPADLNKNLTMFPYKRLDPFTEFAWQAVTVTHASCFANFKPNANMHHKYTAAMERLFGEKIRFRWEHPTQLEDSRMWGTWFLADVDSTHLNFGACISGAYEGAPFSMKLDRPIDRTRSGRKRRDVEKADLQAYWEKYRSSGGVQRKLSGDTQCFQTEESRDAVVNDLKAATCSTDNKSGTLKTFEIKQTEGNETGSDMDDGSDIATDGISDDTPTDLRDDNPVVTSDDNPTGTRDDNPTGTSDDNPTSQSDDNPTEASDDKDDNIASTSDSDDNPTGTSEDKSETPTGITDDDNKPDIGDNNPTVTSDDNKTGAGDDNRMETNEDKLPNDNPTGTSDDNPTGTSDD